MAGYQKGGKRWIKTNTGRKRVNINGALSLDGLTVITRLEDTINADAMILLIKNIEQHQIADILFQSEQTICRFIKGFHQERIASLFPKTLGNEHAAKLTRSQKEQLQAVLSKPPSEYGIPRFTVTRRHPRQFNSLSEA